MEKKFEIIPDINCAYSAISTISQLLSLNQKEIFNQLITYCHELCCLPNDEPCIQALLKGYGFVRQPGKFEHRRIYELCTYMNEHCAPEDLALVRLHDSGIGGMFSELTWNEDKQSFYTCTEYGIYDKSTQFWIRWADGKDHSEVPRRNTGRKDSKKAPAVCEDHEFFHYHQANPATNSAGDCVVRALSAVLDISWHEALDKLAAFNSPTLNTSDLYSEVLENGGFFACGTLRKDRKWLTGTEFCQRANRTCRSGERFFVTVGTHHVAAVLPFPDGNGGYTYKIVDSWDSSSHKIGRYWLLMPSQNR